MRVESSYMQNYGHGFAGLHLLEIYFYDLFVYSTNIHVNPS